MGVDALCDRAEERQLTSMIYWRRRFFALVTGLAILAVIAWAFSGVVGASGGNLAASSGRDSAGHRPHTGGTDSTGSRSTGVSDSGAAAKVSPPSPVVSPAVGSALASPSPEQTQAAGPAPQGPARACSPGDVVISLFSSQASYGPGQLPEFSVDVVSTSASTCAFNVGPRFLALVITADGKRVWSSADCVAGRGSLQTDLARGVPTAVPLSWDRESSAPGCKAPSRQVTTGSFSAAASDAGLASNSLTFKLS
jgi:hypothetical protein